MSKTMGRAVIPGAQGEGIDAAPEVIPAGVQHAIAVAEELLEEDPTLHARYDRLAQRIIEEARVTLMMSFRFMDRALWKLPIRLSSLPVPLGTEGRALHYDAPVLVETFRESPEFVFRSYLHLVLHCVFRHPFTTVRMQPDLWSLACDVCVESIAREMCGPRYALAWDEEAARITADLVACAGGLTPARLYRAFAMAAKVEDALRDGWAKEDVAEQNVQLLNAVWQVRKHADMFELDSHALWDLVMPSAGMNDEGDGPHDVEQNDAQSNADDGASSSDAPQDIDDAVEGEGEIGEGEGAGTGEEADGASSDRENEMPDAEGKSLNWDEASQARDSDKRRSGPSGGDSRAGGAGGGGNDDYSEREAEERSDAEESSADGDMDEWTEISKQIESELRSLGKQRGEGPGSFRDNLALVNRSRIDYADFLRRFSTMGEDMMVNDDEFDYIFYTYGFKLYENMPLIEPLEYKETDRMREFVIAIDTSGSCSAGLVSAFLTRTYEILRDSGTFAERVNVHIIQCDAKVQQDICIKNIEDLAKYEEGFEVRGYGGTDFRPVFTYVNDLLAKKELTDLRGLIYFTDGYGVFPASPPDYEVAFVFVEEDGKDRRVPPWAMKVVLDEDAVFEMEAQGTVPARR